MNPDIKNKILQNHIPKHIAIIMDGNGRWASGEVASSYSWT